ncbi:hypothetical protein FRB90_002852, partial [Tulasnella sp. 427]
IWAVCIVIALAADQAPNTGRWRLLMMSNSEEQEWFVRRVHVVRVAERIIAVLGDDCTLPSHYVSAAVWPTSLSPSFYEEFFRGESDKIRPNREDRKRPSEEHPPSAGATSHLLPHRLESSNPNKVFTEQDWKIYIIDLVSCIQLGRKLCQKRGD